MAQEDVPKDTSFIHIHEVTVTKMTWVSHAVDDVACSEYFFHVHHKISPFALWENA